MTADDDEIRGCLDALDFLLDILKAVEADDCDFLR